jgi:hypothetical protein
MIHFLEDEPNTQHYPPVVAVEMEDLHVKRMDAHHYCHCHCHLGTDSYSYSEPVVEHYSRDEEDSGAPQYYGVTKATFPVNVEDSNNIHIRVEVANDQDNDGGGGLLVWVIEMIDRVYQ